MNTPGTGTPASLGSTAGVGLDPLTCEEWEKTHDAVTFSPAFIFSSFFPFLTFTHLQTWCQNAPDGQEYLTGTVADYAGNPGGTDTICPSGAF